MENHGRGLSEMTAASFLFMTRFDIIALVGLLLLSAGLYFAWPPLALIVPGIVLMVVGLLGARGMRR